jgi:hypothetical protein
VAAFVGGYLPPSEHFRLNLHYLTSESIVVDGITAHGQWIMQQISTYADGRSELFGTRLNIDFRCVDGCWLIAHFRTQRCSTGAECMSTFISEFLLGGSGKRVAIKDSIDIAGHPTRSGSRAFADAPAATKNAEVVDAIIDAGWQIVGKTNLHELAFGVTGINDWTGTPINPQALTGCRAVPPAARLRRSRRACGHRHWHRHRWVGAGAGGVLRWPDSSQLMGVSAASGASTGIQSRLCRSVCQEHGRPDRGDAGDLPKLQRTRLAR